MAEYATKDELLERLVKAARAAKEDLRPYDCDADCADDDDLCLLDQGFANELIAAINAWDAGPKVPPGHCEDCGMAGSYDDEEDENATCSTTDCDNYNGGCEPGQHPGDSDLCPWCISLGMAHEMPGAKPCVTPGCCFLAHPEDDQGKCPVCNAGLLAHLPEGLAGGVA